MPILFSGSNGGMSISLFWLLNQELKCLTVYIVEFLSYRDDGWWIGENAEGKRGMVPSTLLKVSSLITNCYLCF